jgi:hypothetical protein
MNQPQFVFIALVLSWTLSPIAAAGDYKTPVTTRQIAHCMIKRMMADRSESYNAASRTCKEQIQAVQRDDTHETAMNQVDASLTAKK